MTRTLHVERPYAVRPDVLFEIVTDPEFLIARHKAQGAVAARLKEILRNARRLTQEVETDEHVHTMKGVDTSRIETVSTRYDWDLPNRSGTWEYRGRWGKRLHISGRIAVAQADTQARLISDFEIEVRAPLIGSLIERRIVAEIEASLADVAKLTEDYCMRIG